MLKTDAMFRHERSRADRNPFGSKVEEAMFGACFLLLFFCCLCYFLFPTLRGVHLLSGRLRRGGHSAVQHDRDEAFCQRSASSHMFIVIFRSLESGKTVMMCMDVFALSEILEFYNVRLFPDGTDRFFSYTRVYFSHPLLAITIVSVSIYLPFIKRTKSYPLTCNVHHTI